MDPLASLVPSLRRRPRLALAGAGGALLLLALAAPTSARRTMPAAEVREGPFVAHIVEPGVLRARHARSYASSLQGPAKVIALAPEGRAVAAGALLVLFDARPYEEEIRRSQARLAEAEADLLRAQHDLGLQVLENARDRALAEQAAERTRLERLDVEEGSGRFREEEEQARAAEAKRAQEAARAAHEALAPFTSEGLATRQELAEAGAAVEAAEAKRAAAERRLATFRDFERPVERARARSAEVAAQDALAQVQGTFAARLAQKQAALGAAQGRIREASAQLALARQQLARCEVRAEAPGLVVHQPVAFGAEMRRVQVGDQVWPNQAFLLIPDLAGVDVETRVTEADGHRLKAGQRVEVQVEAFPGLVLQGTVTQVATLAVEDPQRRGEKSFALAASLETTDARLRPGMSARVEVVIERRGRALQVPAAALFEKDGRRVVYVVEDGRPRRREVVAGPANRDLVVIEGGLRAGERVALLDPEAEP